MRRSEASDLSVTISSSAIDLFRLVDGSCHAPSPPLAVTPTSPPAAQAPRQKTPPSYFASPRFFPSARLQTSRPLQKQQPPRWHCLLAIAAFVLAAVAAASVLTVLILLNRQAGLQASDPPAKRFVVTFNATFAGSIEEWEDGTCAHTAG